MKSRLDRTPLMSLRYTVSIGLTAKLIVRDPASLFATVKLTVGIFRVGSTLGRGNPDPPPGLHHSSSGTSNPPGSESPQHKNGADDKTISNLRTVIGCLASDAQFRGGNTARKAYRAGVGSSDQSPPIAQRGSFSVGTLFSHQCRSMPAGSISPFRDQPAQSRVVDQIWMSG